MGWSRQIARLGAGEGGSGSEEAGQRGVNPCVGADSYHLRKPEAEALRSAFAAEMQRLYAIAEAG